jgi:hypothetical protein
MEVDRPEIFTVTIRAREVYSRNTENARDGGFANDYNDKILNYVLRITMSDWQLYSRSTSIIRLSENVRVARRNLSRLLRQVDVCNTLPEMPLGIVRTQYPMGPLPMGTAPIQGMMSIPRQRSLLEEFLNSTGCEYIVYCSMYGICEAVCLPTLSVILRDITSAESKDVIRRVRSRFDPFSFATCIIRFVQGTFKNIGNIWYYPKVPMGASISIKNPFLKPWAGTLGCYVMDRHDASSIYALTAGHVIANAEGGMVCAPAERPYTEAVKSIDIVLKDAGPTQLLKYQNHREKLNAYDRSLGTVVFSQMQTVKVNDAPFERIDIGLVKVNRERAADNRVGKLAGGSGLDFIDGADKISLPSTPHHLDDEVFKIGIRTGRTFGTIIQPISVNWDSPVDNVESDVEEEEEEQEAQVASKLVRCPAVLGRVIGTTTATTFADEGDSGSALLRFVRDEKESILKTELMGIVYGVVYEEERDCLVATFMPTETVERVVKNLCDIDIGLSVPDKLESEWHYEELGRGLSIYDIH